MRKFPYFFDVEYHSGRTESLKVRTSKDEARAQVQLKHMVESGVVKAYKPRTPK